MADAEEIRQSLGGMMNEEKLIELQNLLKELYDTQSMPHHLRLDALSLLLGIANYRVPGHRFKVVQVGDVEA